MQANSKIIIYYCKEKNCNNEICYKTWKHGKGRCIRCSNKGENNSMFNVHRYGKLSPNYKGIKHKCVDCGKYLKNIYAKRCLFCANKGKRNGMFGKNHAEKSKKSISKNRIKRHLSRGKNNPMFGKIAKHGKGTYYKGIYMRSSYERKFAFFLDCSRIKWQYESKRFYMENITYLPDFYLPEFDCYIEIKGWWRDNDKRRFKLFKKNYPNENIKLLMKPDLEEKGIL